MLVDGAGAVIVPVAGAVVVFVVFVVVVLLLDGVVVVPVALFWVSTPFGLAFALPFDPGFGNSCTVVPVTEVPVPGLVTVCVLWLAPAPSVVTVPQLLLVPVLLVVELVSVEPLEVCVLGLVA